MSAPTPDWTLGDVEDWMRHNIKDGVECPACHLKAKIYKRPLNRTAARTLIALLQHRGHQWTHISDFAEQYLSDIAGQGGYLLMGQHWGLIEEERSVRRDDGGRVGYWRLTSRGAQFVRGELEVLSHARLYGGRLLNHFGKPIGISDALREPFDLRAIQ